MVSHVIIHSLRFPHLEDFLHNDKVNTYLAVRMQNKYLMKETERELPRLCTLLSGKLLNITCYEVLKVQVRN